MARILSSSCSFAHGEPKYVPSLATWRFILDGRDDGERDAGDALVLQGLEQGP